MHLAPAAAPSASGVFRLRAPTVTIYRRRPTGYGTADIPAEIARFALQRARDISLEVYLGKALLSRAIILSAAIAYSQLSTKQL